MAPKIDNWMADNLDFFGTDTLPHGFYKTFPSPYKLNGSWWSDSSFEDEYYNVIPKIPYLQITYQDKLLFIIVQLHFTRPLKPYFPIKISMKENLYAKIDVVHTHNSYVWTCQSRTYTWGIRPSFITTKPHIDIPTHSSHYHHFA